MYQRKFFENYHNKTSSCISCIWYSVQYMLKRIQDKWFSCGYISMRNVVFKSVYRNDNIVDPLTQLTISSRIAIDTLASVGIESRNACSTMLTGQGVTEVDLCHNESTMNDTSHWFTLSWTTTRMLNGTHVFDTVFQYIQPHTRNCTN